MHLWLVEDRKIITKYAAAYRRVGIDFIPAGFEFFWAKSEQEVFSKQQASYSRS